MSFLDFTNFISDASTSISDVSTTVSDFTSFSSPYISLGTTAHATKKLQSTQRTIDLPKPLQTGNVVAKTIKFTDKLVPELESSSIADLHSADFLGPAGAIVALTIHTMNLAVRSGRALELNQELEKLPKDPQLVWKRQLLEAQSKHAQGHVKMSAAIVGADSLCVVGSFVPIIGGIPATLIGGASGLLKLAGEKRLNSRLRQELEKIADNYRSYNASIIQNHAAFKEMHETLKSNYEQAIGERERATSQADINRTELAVSDAAKHLEEYEISKANFEAYGQALQLIRELEPKETPIEEREPQEITDMRLSSFNGVSESIEFTPTSHFSLDYIEKSGVGVSKNDRELEKIGIPKKNEAPAPVKQNSQKDRPSSPFRLSEIVSNGELSFLSGF